MVSDYIEIREDSATSTIDNRTIPKKIDRKGVQMGSRLSEHGGPEIVRDSDGNDVALIVRNNYAPHNTEFITPSEYNQQLGFVVYKKGEEVATHMHLPIERTTRGTSEVIILRKGKAVVNLYKTDKTFVGERTLNSGDVILLINGWHGIKFIEDTVLMEIKQGPYLGLKEKVMLKTTARGAGVDSGK